MKTGDWLGLCLGLAAGEYVASLVPQAAAIWPLTAAVALLAVLFGYGFGLRRWPAAAMFLLGATLFFAASVESEAVYRERPWLREWGERRTRRVNVPGAKYAAALRRECSRRVGLGLEPAAAGLAQAILLGERTHLSPATRRRFVDSGTMHVFAISGLHVMTVARTLTLLLVVLFVPVRLAGLVALPLLWGYVWMIGLPPSAVRAATMASFMYLAPVWWRRGDALHAWIWTFLGFYALQPRMIGNVGAALSFAVMLAIVLGNRLFGSVAGWRGALRTTFFAWLAGAPIMAHIFGTLTPGGLLANIPLLAAAGFTVGFGILGLLASFLSPTLAAHLNNLSALFTETMTGIAELVSRLPGAHLAIRPWTVLECLAFYLLLAVAIWLYRRWRDRQLF